MLVLAVGEIWIRMFILLFLLVSLLMLFIVLIQRPQGGGLSGAFGAGSGSGQTALGAKTGDALTVATFVIFVGFVVTAVGLNYGMRPSEDDAAVITVGDEEGAETDAATESESDDASGAPVVPFAGQDAEGDAPSATPETTDQAPSTDESTTTSPETPADGG